MPQHDRDLVALALEGKQHAYSQLMQRYKEPLGAYLQHQFLLKNDTEDLVLVVFDKAFRKLKSYDPQFAFSTWLYAIADNSCIDYIRKQKSLVRSIRLVAHTAELHDTETSSDPESELIASQKASLLLGSIDRLKPIYREPLRLRYLYGYAYEEIAQELSIPQGTVKARIHRAKEILSKWITPL